MAIAKDGGPSVLQQPNPPDNQEYLDLRREIKELQSQVEPLQDEVITTPMWPVVARVMSLSLEGGKKAEEVKREVEECQRLMEEMAFYLVEQIIAKPNPSKVFRIVNNSNIFKKGLRKAIGKRVTLSTGESLEITPQLVKFLSRFEFSIGTPPITLKGMDTIEKILFGGNLKDVYGFRNLLGTEVDVFDRFMKIVDRTVTQSTHYTTADEKKEFERNSRDFTNLEGTRGFTKTAVSGSAKSAVRLIRDHLFSQHSNGSTPLTEVTIDDLTNEHEMGQLVDRMNKNRTHIFVAKVKSVPHNVFTSDILKEEWHGILGRLILVEDSENSNRSATTMVYSLNPLVTETLAKFHVKDSGTLSNTQLNLRSVLEGFSDAELGRLKGKVEGKIAYFEGRGVCKEKIGHARKREWILNAQQDYVSLKCFLKFLSFIERIKTGSPDQVEDLNNSLISAEEKLEMDYFFKDLPQDEYSCICVPQGGGRREIGLIGQYHLAKHRSRVDEFRQKHLDESKARLAVLKQLNRTPDGTSEAETAAADRALSQLQDPDQAIRDLEENDVKITNGIRETIRQAIHRGAQDSETIIKEVWRTLLEDILGKNITGKFHKQISEFLENAGRPSAAKIFERMPFRLFANRLRNLEGNVRQLVERALLEPAENLAGKTRRRYETHSLERVEKMINDVSKKGAFEPSLILPEMRWSFNDVLSEDDYPAQNYVTISMDKNGEMALDSLEKQLEKVQEELAEFPEFFELYCSSILLIFNDPHNPTSHVAGPKTKLKILQIASKYNLSLLADEAYHKMINKDLKEENGDLPLATFYEFYKSHFPNPVTIYSSLPSTKWGMGAGRRTGNIITNDLSEHDIMQDDKTETSMSFEDFVRGNVDGVNSMSLYMDIETLKSGKSVKKVCKKLEPLVLMPLNAEKVFDEILAELFKDFEGENFAAPVYFKLAKARNDLDRLNIREADPSTVSQFVSELISELKDLRLDKQTRKDTEKRVKAGIKAVEKLSESEFPGLKERYIKPEGPFYMCINLDQTESDSGLQMFVEAIAKARNISAIPVGKGEVRFSFGGMLDGTPESYELLSEVFETDLRLLLQYWEKFKQTRAELNAKKDLDPNGHALTQLFPGGEIDLFQAIEDKKPLLESLKKFKEKGKEPLVFQTSSDASKFISTIQPDSDASIVTIKGVACRSMQEFIKSKPFSTLFNFYLLKIKDKIPQLKSLSDGEALGHYGALKFQERSLTRIFRDGERETFSQIAMEIAKLWFSDNTIKVLAESFDGAATDLQKRALMGTEKIVSEYIKEFLRIFISEEQEESLDVNPTFQIGYQALKGVKADSSLPPWLKSLVESSEFAGQTVPTDPSPEMVTGGRARVAGFDYGIYRRDGDGENAPSREFFRDRLQQFVEKMNPKDYVCKMVQVGSTKTLLVMHRSYTHYMAEEMRLFPQFEVSPAELKSLKPDAVSFMGIPRKVMGDNYKIGYYFDKNEQGENIPISWVDAEQFTDYVGYLKKPILTVANEKVKEVGGMPVHGSAFTVVFKNGLRKTLVIGGDSGAGKSETIIAMVEQAIKEEGEAEDVEGIDMLAGDMLSMFEGDDKQLYMLGTEEGDFMRMSDISDDWKTRFRDRIEKASVTNRNHPTNPRTTIGGLCDTKGFLQPVRVNMFFHINNFEVPQGPSFQEIKSPENLLMNTYVRGYRREKGTSGDQPNLYASLLYSEVPNRDQNLQKYREDFDKLIGWQISLAPSGKVDRAILSFKDLPNQIARAKSMVRDLFEGQSFVDEKGQQWSIKKTNYNPKKNRFSVSLFNEEFGESERELDRSIFDKVYNPVVSTYCGNPFVHPEGMEEVLQRFSGVMREAGVITGVLYSKLAVDGEQFSGPAQASKDVIGFIKRDPKITERFQRFQKVVHTRLREKYGEAMVSQASLPERLKAYNLFQLERHTSNSIKFVNADGKHIDVSTPHYRYNSEAASREFNPSITTPEVQSAIGEILDSNDYKRYDISNFVPNLEYYEPIKTWDNKEELIYQIMMVNGFVRLGDDVSVFRRAAMEVKKAEKIADAIIQERKLAD